MQHWRITQTGLIMRRMTVRVGSPLTKKDFVTMPWIMSKQDDVPESVDNCILVDGHQVHTPLVFNFLST